MRPPAETFLSPQLSLCPTDLFGASGSKPLKPQRSLPGTPVSGTQFPIDLRTSMEEKYKEIAEVREMTLLRTSQIPTFMCFSWDEYQILKGFVWICQLDSPMHKAQLPPSGEELPPSWLSRSSVSALSFLQMFFSPSSRLLRLSNTAVLWRNLISAVCIPGRVPLVTSQNSWPSQVKVRT